jgi:rare lipoprotein A (peptidoglycan hydrolase)
MRTHLRHALITVAAAALLACPATALASPSRPPSGPAVPSVTSTNSVARSAIKLQRSIDAIKGRQVSIDSRIAVTGALVVKQTAALDAANEALTQAQTVYDNRVIAMYEAGDYDMFSILLDANSFTDLVARLELMTRILESDRASLEEVAIVASQAQFQAGQLEALTAQGSALNALKATTASQLATSVAEQQTVDLSLDSVSLARVDDAAAEDAAYRAKWRAASVPMIETAPHRSARVLPYPQHYVSSKYHFAKYQTTHVRFAAIATWYGSDFNGRETASGELFNASDFTCAHMTLPIGTWLAISRSDPVTKTTRRVVVVVNDRGPYVEGQDLELSQAAADVLGLTTTGGGKISVEVVKPVS